MYLQTICKWIVVTQELSVIKSWENDNVLLWSFGVKEKQDRIILSFFLAPWSFSGKSSCLFNNFYILSSDFSNLMNKNCQMYKLESKEGSLIHGHIPNIWWKMEKARKFQKGIYFCFFYYYTKKSQCVDYNRLWIVLKNTGYFIYLMKRNVGWTRSRTIWSI